MAAPPFIPSLSGYPRTRNALYLIVGTVGVLAFLAVVGFGAADAPIPTWLVVVGAVVNAAASLFFVASQNTPAAEPPAYVGRRIKEPDERHEDAAG